MLRRGVRTACTIHPGTAVWAQEARILRSRDEFGVVGATTEEVAELSEFDGASDGVHVSTVDLADLSHTDSRIVCTYHSTAETSPYRLTL